MRQSRRSYLRNTSALLALLSGASATASAAETPPTWEPDVAYTGGDRVTHNGYIWEAKWWTKGDEPTTDANMWKQIGEAGGGGGIKAAFTASDTYVEPGVEISFDASGSSGSPTSYEWDFGDGATGTGETVTHTYESEKEYTVTLTVGNEDGTDTTSKQVTVSQNAPSDEFSVVGYYPSWKGNEDYQYYPEDIPFDKVTDVLYAFLNVKSDGSVVIPDSEVDHKGLLQSFADLKQGPAADTTLKLSIGGWALSPGFEDAAANEANRTRFAETAVSLMRKYDFDGIDIDWEHPGPNRGACECGSSEGPANHVKLLKAVRNKLDTVEEEDGRTYYLSVANGGSDWNASLVKHREVERVVDEIYMMSYDFTGVWHETAGLNAPIYGTPDDYPPSGDAQQYTLETTLEIWKEQGYWVDWMQWEDYGEPVEDPASLVLGLPFYGRGCKVENGIWDTFSLSDWQQGDPQYQNEVIPPGTWNHLLGSDQANTGAFDYGDLEENYEGADGWQKNVNEQGQVPWLWNEEKGIFISYDDPASIEEKVKLAKSEGLGGVMFWELSQDYNGSLLDAIDGQVNQ
ncbi:PKD domain-containing protein (plasmid) [Haloferax mediterranei ATCC 33500]|uniref:Chitinase n=1 Tax=Haloferax mediterranei (strain ATCC 33500 / DSM 1411 / JCM 8866 / NBRC 14739 / NCIMB 2177 / R-4) TaxID=523841 RepID=I3R9G5_HALMT|nr:glycosyl hydrolase family 18 protein [Haloferax mediterranei]AFK20875.1 chitinase [Haloferax mediterranei ATCC 33500]AHZ24256.1 chitinase [Haloferax mediterranei ATCC 33500]MDX5989863.1 glycosyl hydrolase family 18 protein [Haloferax mediterranei ATCC 33500]QCQ77304.1 PKD domain-containing protein [Haloferax mediterranei ATCC 33500]